MERFKFPTLLESNSQQNFHKTTKHQMTLVPRAMGDVTAEDGAVTYAVQYLQRCEWEGNACISQMWSRLRGGGCAVRGLGDRPPSIKPIDPSVCSCNTRTLGYIFLL